MRLILVRHAQTESNVRALLDTGDPGAGLTELGRQQAADLVGRLADQDIERIVASPLARTRATAAPLAEATGVEPRFDLRLREVLAGDLELRNDRAAIDAYLGAVLAWGAGDLDARVPGSPEDGHDFFGRFDAAVGAAVARASGAVVVVSHGAAIRVWAGVRAVDLPDLFGDRRGLPNTGVVVLDGEPGGWHVVEWDREAFTAARQDPTGGGVPVDERTAPPAERDARR